MNDTIKFYLNSVLTLVGKLRTNYSNLELGSSQRTRGIIFKSCLKANYLSHKSVTEIFILVTSAGSDPSNDAVWIAHSTPDENWDDASSEHIPADRWKMIDDPDHWFYSMKKAYQDICDNHMPELLKKYDAPDVEPHQTKENLDDCSIFDYVDIDWFLPSEKTRKPIINQVTYVKK